MYWKSASNNDSKQRDMAYNIICTRLNEARKFESFLIRHRLSN